MIQRKRYVEFDIMRIVACICVIMIHSAVFDQKEQYLYWCWDYQAINIWGCISRWAVPAFVMLSGALLLPSGDEEPLKKLMFHRVLRMVLTYIIWSCVYSFYNTYILGIVYAPTKFKTFIDGCFSGETHMWYLLMLAGLYCIMPMLTTLVKKLNQRWLKYWLFGMFLFSSVIPFVIHMDIKFLSTIVNSLYGYADVQFLGGWTFYFVLGHIIFQYDFKKTEKIVIGLIAAFSFLFTIYGTVIYSVYHEETMGILTYQYPNIVFFSVGVFLLFKELGKKIKFSTKAQKLIISISDLTFGIYLIHILLLKVWYSLGINIQMFHPIFSIPTVAIIVFASSAIIIFVIRKIPIFGKYFA